MHDDLAARWIGAWALLGGIAGPVYIILFTPEPHSLLVAVVAIPFGAFAGVVAGFIVGAVVDVVWAVVRNVKALRARRSRRRLERLQVISKRCTDDKRTTRTTSSAM